MKRFHVQFAAGHTLTLSADFMTTTNLVSTDSATVRFWVKPHWYSRRRCVGMLDWDAVVSISTAPDAEDLAHELGVKL